MAKATMLVALWLACQPGETTTELLPPPTGPQAVGRTSFHWVDEGRDELETKAPDDRRELMVHLFYPADGAVGASRAVYAPDADVMRGPWKDDQIVRMEAMRAYAIEGAPPVAGNDRWPVAVFMPGGGMKALTYHTLLEDLASHGWVVAAIDPPYNARGVRLPNGRVLGPLKSEERGWPEPRSPDEYQQFYRERIAHWAADIRFVLNQLAVLDQADGPLKGRIDLARGVGAVGHSRGGQAAGAVRLIDPRVRGGINIDGTAGDQVVQAVLPNSTSGQQPFLWIQRPLPPPPTDEQLKRAGRTLAEYDAEVARILARWESQLQSIKGGAWRLTFNRPGIEHIDFSDEPFWDGTTSDENRAGRLQTIAETRAWVRAFLDGAVRE